LMFNGVFPRWRPKWADLPEEVPEENRDC